MKLDNIKLFYAFNFLLDFRPYWPIAIIYFESVTHSYASAMAVFSIVFMLQSLLEIPTGVISDRIGRRKTLIAGSFFSFLAILLYATGMNFYILAVGGFCEGLSRSLFSGTNKAFLYESLKENGDENNFGKVYGQTNAMFQAGLASSALLSSCLALHSLSLVLWVSAVPQFLCFMLCLLFRETQHVERSDDHILIMLKSAVRQFKENRKLRLIGLAEILEFGFGEAVFQAAFFKLVIPEWMIGIVRSFIHVCSASGAWFSDGVLNRLGYKKTLIGGNIAMLSVQYLALLIPTALSPFMMALTSLNYGVSNTVRNDLMQKEFSDHQRATMDSMVSLAGSILFSVVSTGLGYLADKQGPAFAMMAALASGVIVIIIYKRAFSTQVAAGR